MLAPAFSFANLVEALILIPASTFTLNKLYQGSKSNFAYLIITFTLANGICRLAYFFLYLYPNQKVQLPNGYATTINDYFFWLLSLQSWIFGIKYLWSGILCSDESTCLFLDCVKWLGWTGSLCYVIFMITCWCIAMATFPGYNDFAKFKEWYHNTFYPVTYWS